MRRIQPPIQLPISKLVRRVQRARGVGLAFVRGPITLLNAPVITAEGVFKLERLPTAEARALVARHGFDSAIGHAATAQLISTLLGIDCQMQRREFQQRVGQAALVFRLARRLPEGKVLADASALAALEHHFALLVRQS